MALPIAPLVGAGLGALGSIFGGRPSGPDPASREAMDYWRRIMGFGGQGFEAVTGAPGGVERFMNPFTQTLDPYFDQLRQQSLSAAGSRAAMSGAFGGSRQGVIEGQALGDIAGQQAGLKHQEFTNAMNRALQVAGMGQGAAGDLFRGGDYLRSIREGQRSNLFGSALGGAMTGFGLFPGGGQQGAGPTSGTPNLAAGNALFDEFMRQRRQPGTVTSPFGGF